MTNIIKYSGILALVILAIIGISKLVPSGSVLGTAASCATDVTCFTKLAALTTFQVDGTSIYNGAISILSTLTVGSTGTAISKINTGTCYIQSYATTIPASTTKIVECQGTKFIRTPNWNFSSALAGVVKDDNVVVTLSTTTARKSTFGGIVVEGASASSTAGYIDLIVGNYTGTTFTWPTTLSATGTASYIVTR